MSKMALTIPVMSPKCLLGGMMSHFSYDWPADFHAKFYDELHADLRSQKHRLTPQWWGRRVVDLRGWAAIRPLSNKAIYDSGLPLLPDLNREYQIILRKKKTNIAACSWNDAAGLFNVAAKIKTTKGNSPALASKLCHFIMPGLFPVLDTESLQDARSALKFGNDYEKYWNWCHYLWRQCNCKQELNHIMYTEIMKEYNRTTHFPWTVKITGLCLMNSSTS